MSTAIAKVENSYRKVTHNYDNSIVSVGLSKLGLRRSFFGNTEDEVEAKYRLSWLKKLRTELPKIKDAEVNRKSQKSQKKSLKQKEARILKQLSERAVKRLVDALTHEQELKEFSKTEKAKFELNLVRYQEKMEADREARKKMTTQKTRGAAAAVRKSLEKKQEWINSVQEWTEKKIEKSKRNKEKLKQEKVKKEDTKEFTISKRWKRSILKKVVPLNCVDAKHYLPKPRVRGSSKSTVLQKKAHVEEVSARRLENRTKEYEERLIKIEKNKARLSDAFSTRMEKTRKDNQAKFQSVLLQSRKASEELAEKREGEMRTKHEKIEEAERKAKLGYKSGLTTEEFVKKREVFDSITHRNLEILEKQENYQHNKRIRNFQRQNEAWKERRERQLEKINSKRIANTRLSIISQKIEKIFFDAKEDQDQIRDELEKMDIIVSLLKKPVANAEDQS